MKRFAPGLVILGSLLPAWVGAQGTGAGEGTADPTAEVAAPAESATEAEASPSADERELSFDVHGYWRARGTFLKNLFMGQANFADVGRTGSEPSEGRLRALEQTGFFEHGLRVTPSASYRDLLAVHLDLDILEGVIWGDNNAIAAVPMFAGSPSSNARDGKAVDTIAARRAWVELKLPLGLLRVGRQPSNWGLGLLANAGDGLDSDFGDFRYGSTVDRILFATRPLQIVNTILGADDPSSNILMAVAYDQLADDAIDDEDPDAERICDTCAPQIQLARPGDDVQEWVGVLVYKNENANIWQPNDIIQAGAYVVYRTQAVTRSRVVVVDGHAKLRIGPVGLETELLWITGRSKALDGDNPFDEFPADSPCVTEATPTEVAADRTQCKDLSVLGGVVRGGYYTDLFDAELEVGQAPGYSSATGAKFTGFPFHADYNVGLILYEEVLATRTARAWGNSVRGLWSKGGVFNSRYVMPKVRYRPIPGLTAIAAFLWARADENDGVVGPKTRDPENGSDLDLGWEVDLAVRYDFSVGAHVKLEGGFFRPGKALWRDTNGDQRITDDDRGDTVYTGQMRLGVEF